MALIVSKLKGIEAASNPDADFEDVARVVSNGEESRKACRWLNLGFGCMAA